MAKEGAPKAKEKRRVGFNSNVGVATFDRAIASKLKGRQNPDDDYEKGGVTREADAELKSELIDTREITTRTHIGEVDNPEVLAENSAADAVKAVDKAKAYFIDIGTNNDLITHPDHDVIERHYKVAHKKEGWLGSISDYLGDMWDKFVDPLLSPTEEKDGFSVAIPAVKEVGAEKSTLETKDVAEIKSLSGAGVGKSTSEIKRVVAEAKKVVVTKVLLKAAGAGVGAKTVRSTPAPKYKKPPSRS